MSGPFCLPVGGKRRRHADTLPFHPHGFGCPAKFEDVLQKISACLIGKIFVILHIAYLIISRSSTTRRNVDPRYLS